MEQREETVHLKQYVKQHPDNKMAWYLLGKEYAMQGKEAKANYCFLQSGEVYEAFERKQHPIVQRRLEAIEQWASARQRKKVVRRAVMTGILMIGMVAAAPGDQADWKSEMTQQSVPVVKPEDTDAGTGITIVFINGTDLSALGELAARMVDAVGWNQESLVAVRMEQEEPFRHWTAPMTILLSAKRPAGGGIVTMALHDAEACRCEPADAGEAVQALQSWRGQQESRWVLSSAIRLFKERNGRWPKAINELVRPYPDNYLAGDSDVMNTMFPEVIEWTKRQAEYPDSGTGAEAQADGRAESVDERGSFGGGTAYNVVNLPQQPLEIIVDRANYRLAVVSGDVIVRSYKVGLGGSRTPEGDFYISEKVKNPNGREDGEFGSRGMTLSETRYAIHGTDEPSSIGKDESLGCIRMAKEDIEELYDLVPLGTKVTIKSGILPDSLSAPSKPFRLTPREDETNPAVIYRWL
ncbi:L,D-transpeptidase [Paenibacillus tarimensis]